MHLFSVNDMVDRPHVQLIQLVINNLSTIPMNGPTEETTSYILMHKNASSRGQYQY